METTQGKAVNAFMAITRLASSPMPSFAAYKLFKLKKLLRDAVEFQTEQEKKLVDEMGGTVNDSNGRVMFDDPEKYLEFSMRQKELQEMEYEVDSEKLIMYMKELPNISIADIETLEPFIEWKE